MQIPESGVMRNRRSASDHPDRGGISAAYPCDGATQPSGSDHRIAVIFAISASGGTDPQRSGGRLDIGQLGCRAVWKTQLAFWRADRQPPVGKNRCADPGSTALRGDRLPGASDEFALLLRQQQGETAADRAKRFSQALAAPVRALLGHYDLRLACGFCNLQPGERIAATELYRRASLARMRAKRDGMGGYLYYTAEMGASDARRRSIERQAAQALDTGEFKMALRPIFFLFKWENLWDASTSKMEECGPRRGGQKRVFADL